MNETANVKVENNRDISQTNKRTVGGSKVYLFVKRTFDIVASGLGMIVLSPVFLVLSLIIKLNDGGNVFYKHERFGKDGKKIYLYKFRSMKMNADNLEEMLSPEELEIFQKEFKLENDPRITKVGKFLRETSLDELPQLLNIFKGDMSVIGPRPIVEAELENYGKDAEHFLSVTPGLTGYWQAYARNGANYDSGERQKMELYYIDNRSLWMDIKVFFRTFVAVFQKTGS